MAKATETRIATETSDLVGMSKATETRIATEISDLVGTLRILGIVSIHSSAEMANLAPMIRQGMIFRCFPQHVVPILVEQMWERRAHRGTFCSQEVIC